MKPQASRQQITHNAQTTTQTDCGDKKRVSMYVEDVIRVAAAGVDHSIIKAAINYKYAIESLTFILWLPSISN